MNLVLHFITSFIASAAFGILFNAPKRTLLQCGFSGMLGWAAYILLGYRLDTIYATVASTIIVGVVSQIFARTYKKPVIIFSVSGIIPLVPGGMAYDAMRNFVEKEYNTAIQLAAQAFLISGSIAIGLVLSEVLNQIIRKIWMPRPKKVRAK
ncbi:threonine/serine exporter family protein [Paenibacillus vini]|uniref:threonine/serine exporter family protein n=1 Tax=Paenibacillus vini TaxID=1476024 RepID=UPI0025B69F86|nr:threonine/serine exporter family protein [Paenibacillus vini]MDN4068621.1 threonine/serine exporter family protein [Paenibacillus vini]